MNDVRRLVTPRCCEQMLKTPAISLSLPMGYGDGDQSIDDIKPFWTVIAHTTHENMRAKWADKELERISPNDHLTETTILASFCPFCGTKTPEIVRRDVSELKVCLVTDGGYYCDTCSERLMSCRCYPPLWNWKPKENQIMSYAIGQIVYGIDASEDSTLLNLVQRWINENQDSEIDEIAYAVEDMDSAEGFQEHWCKQFYSANGPTPAVFGVELGGKIDECDNVTIARLVEMGKVTEKALKEWADRWERLPESLRQKISAAGLTPEAFVLWSSS